MGSEGALSVDVTGDGWPCRWMDRGMRVRLHLVSRRVTRHKLTALSAPFDSSPGDSLS